MGPALVKRRRRIPTSAQLLHDSCHSGTGSKCPIARRRGAPASAAGRPRRRNASRVQRLGAGEEMRATVCGRMRTAGPCGRMRAAGPRSRMRATGAANRRIMQQDAGNWPSNRPRPLARAPCRRHPAAVTPQARIAPHRTRPHRSLDQLLRPRRGRPRMHPRGERAILTPSRNYTVETKRERRRRASSTSASEMQKDSRTNPGAPKQLPGTSPTPASSIARSQNSSSPSPVAAMLGNA